MRRFVRSLSLASAFILPLVACDQFTPEAVASAGSTAMVIESVVQGLREASDNAAQAFDQVAANRLEEAANRLAALLPALQGVLDGAEKNANGVVDNAMRELAGTLGTLRGDLQSIGGYATANVNTYLAQASMMMDAIPFVNVPPAVFSISPSVLDSLTARRSIRIAGHIPGTPNVDVRLAVNGTATDVNRAARHSLTFVLPESLVKPGAAIELQLRVRQRLGPWGLFWKWHEFTETIRVSVAEPFTCLVDTFEENPSYLKTVASTRAFEVQASTQGSANRANENRSLSAVELFQSTVGDSASLFDSGTVRVVEVGARFQGYGGGCGDGPSWSGQILQGGLLVNIRAVAPYFKRRTQRRGLKIRYCDQGGTKAVVSLRPVYKAALESAPLLRRTKSDTLRLGDAGAGMMHVFGNKDNWAYHVACSYRDGAESWSSARATIGPKNSSSVVRGLQVRVAEDRLLLEPLAPIRFVDLP